MDCKDGCGRTPLSWAAEHGEESIVVSLVSEGAEVNCEDDSGRTPVWWAAENDHKSVINLLVRYGAVLGHTENIAKNTLRSCKRKR